MKMSTRFQNILFRWRLLCAWSLTGVILLLLLFTPSTGFSQSKLDSLKHAWEDSSHPDTLRMQALYQLVKEGYHKQNLDSALLLSQTLFVFAETRGNKIWMAKALHLKGYAHFYWRGYDEMIELLQEAKVIYEGIGDQKGIALEIGNIGNGYSKKGELEKAIALINEAIALRDSHNIIEDQSLSYIHLGNAYKRKGDIQTAIECYDKAEAAAVQLGDKKMEMTSKGANAWAQMGLGNYQAAKEGYEVVAAFREKTGETTTLALAYRNLGVCNYRLGAHKEAISYYTRALKIYEKEGDLEGQSSINSLIGDVYSLQNDQKEARYHFLKAVELCEQSCDNGTLAGRLYQLADSYYLEDDYTNALKYFSDALVRADSSGNKWRMCGTRIGIGKTNLKQNEIDRAIAVLNDSKEIGEEIDSKKMLVLIYNYLGQAYNIKGQTYKAIAYGRKAVKLGKETNSIIDLANAGEALYETYDKANMPGPALEMYQLYIGIRDSLRAEENQRALIHQAYQYEFDKKAFADSLDFLKKEAEKDLEIEKHTARISRQRLALGLGGLGGILLIALAWSIYKGKKRSDELLHNILPEEVAKELKQKGEAKAQLIDQVTVLFTDFKGFTQYAEKISPEQLVMDIHLCFTAFDNICDKYGIERIKTIGDAYMAAGGLPVPNKTNPESVVNAALEIRDFIEVGKAKKEESGDPYFEIRIGIHTGPVVAGIVGVKKFSYDIWGDTVNTASRMESSGQAGKVNISEATFQFLKSSQDFEFENRGKVQAKGKGEMNMYFVDLKK